MSVFNKVVISLLAVASAGVININTQADMIDVPAYKVAPESNYVVEVNTSNVRETGESYFVTDATVISTQDMNAVASAEERAAVVVAKPTEVSEIVIEDTVVPDEIEIAEATETDELEVAETVVESEAVETTAEVVEVATTTATTTTVVVVETTVETTVAEPTPAPVSINYPSQGTSEYDLFILINNVRQANGLAPLSYRYDLAGAAAVRAGECVESFSHTRPDGSDYYTVNADIVYAENLAVGYVSAQDVFDAWMASPDHRANILDSDYTACGFAFCNGSDGNCYWAQEFGYAD